MNKAIELRKILLISLLAIVVLSLFTACGSKRNPTGGKEDTEKPEVVASLPEAYAELSDQKVEFSFSKPMDRASLLKGLYIYPPVLNKKIYYDANVITVKLLEALQQDTNYYFTLTTRIKDVRGNPLKENQTFIYRHGALQKNRISGAISYEDAKDAGSPIQLNLLSADSLWVLAANPRGSSYVLEGLNPQPYILRAYIDKNLNGRYDYAREPFFETNVARQSLINIDLQMAYADTIKPVLKSVRTVSEREFLLTLNKEIKSLRTVEITSVREKTLLPVLITRLETNTITVLTAPADTSRWTFTLLDATDAKGNKQYKSSLTVPGTDKPDKIPPSITGSVPRSGTSVNNLQPVLEVTFSEIIPQANLKASLKESESGKTLPFKILQSYDKTYRFQPEKPLTNYRSCLLTIESATSDLSGNPLKEPYRLVFLPIYREK